MIYQEQIIQIARIMADYTLGEADILRKAMSKKKKEVLLKEEEKFTKRAMSKGYDKNIVDKVYKLMLKFSEYGFNKSHSIAYSIIAYKMAYLKSHYPTNFMIYLLSMEINDQNKTKQYIYEAKKYGIKVLEPSINTSEKKYKQEKKGIRYPLSNIKNVGIQATDYILNERQKGKFIDIYDFIRRCYGKVINKKVSYN
jgi:DNA polymerase-3 subunit alpha